MGRLRHWKGWKHPAGRFVWEHLRPFAFLTLVLFAARSSLADWNDVPTGSMNPTILEGDRIFVNKLAYDLKVPFTTWRVARWSDPVPGEVVIFYSPVDGERMVKRVAGGPGDTVQMIDDRLIVNGKPVQYGPADPDAVADFPATRRTGHEFETESLAGHPHPVMQTPALPARRTFGPITVPPDKYLLLGDNRDNSYDSRYWGFVDRGQIVGRAAGVVYSLDPERSHQPRWGRVFQSMP
jgi:signal peptidase I